MGNLTTVLLQISSRLRRWKNFENQPVFDEVMPKILLVRFFPDTVYIAPVITAARPAYEGTEGCYRLLVFFISFFIKRISVKTAKRCLAPYMAGRRPRA